MDGSFGAKGVGSFGAQGVGSFGAHYQADDFLFFAYKHVSLSTQASGCPDGHKTALL